MIRTATIFTLVFAALSFLSCEVIGLDSDKKTTVELSVREQNVSSSRGSQYISVRCNGAWTLSLVSDEGDVVWARLSATQGDGDKSDIVFSYDKNDTEHARELRIVLSSRTKWTDCTFIQNSAVPEVVPDPGHPSAGSMDLSKFTWMELPASDNPDLGYYTHSFSMNGKKYRNYSFGWSQKDRIALWVAYPLSRVYMSGYDGRTDAWALDPLLGSLSSAPFGGYAGNYARGHQLASEDRQCCYEANAQTFYGTNIVPQIQDNFNGGIWATLEGRVREFARSADTLYVVTGVVVSSSSKKETDSYGNSVTVPDAFFKALLKYSKSSTLGAWNAAAFYYKHTTYSGGVQKSHSMSIDELEEMTGIDFFANLPAKIGEAGAANVEKQDPANSSMWW